MALFGLCAAGAAQEASERRIVVGGLNESGHFVYAFKGERPLILVQSDEPKLPKTIQFANRSGRSLKVQFFHGGDKARVVPRSTVTLPNGKAQSLPFGVYSAKVFEVGVLDKLILTSSNFVSDSEIRSRNTGGKRSYVLTSVQHAFSVQNNTKETFQVSVFNRGDTARIVPRFVLTCPPQKTTRWQDPLAQPFRIRIHPNRILAAPISTDRSANAHSAVVIQGQDWSPWKTLMRKQIVNGRLSDTNDPLVLRGVQDLTVDPVAVSHSSRRANREQPRLYGRTEAGKLYILRLDDSPVSDGMSVVHRSADWRIAAGGEGESWNFGPFASTPWVAIQQSVFARGAAGDLITKPLYVSPTTQAMNESGPWRSLGGKIDGRPAAVAFGTRGKERFMAFVGDAVDGTLKSRTTNIAGEWGAWQALGGSIQGNPSACVLYTGSYDSRVVLTPTSVLKSRIHVFARGADNSLMTREWVEGSGWSPWTSLGGQLTSAPNVQSENILTGPAQKRTFQHRIHLTAKGPEGETLYRAFDGAKWSAWLKIGPKLASDPIVFSSDDNG